MYLIDNSYYMYRYIDLLVSSGPDHSPTHFRNPDKFPKFTELFSIEIMNIENFLWSETFQQPKYFWTFLVEENFIYFRDFSYELENCETLENDIRNVVNRIKNIWLNFSRLFL